MAWNSVMRFAKLRMKISSQNSGSDPFARLTILCLKLSNICWNQFFFASCSNLVARITGLYGTLEIYKLRIHRTLNTFSRSSETGFWNEPFYSPLLQYCPQLCGELPSTWNRRYNLNSTNNWSNDVKNIESKMMWYFNTKTSIAYRNISLCESELKKYVLPPPLLILIQFLLLHSELWLMM